MSVASALIADVRSLLAGEPAYLAGSLVAEETYGLSDAHSDVDIFCPTTTSFMVVGQKLIDNGYTLGVRDERPWYRWRRWGFNKFHTNSLHLIDPNGVDTNVVYKTQGGQPTSSLSQVLESFDFGLLGTGYDLESNTRHDLRPFLFPGLDLDAPLPMMPSKRENWRRGFISQYNGIRESGRYVKYLQYGHDMSLVKDDLVTGYRMGAMNLSVSFREDKRQLGEIFETIGKMIDADMVDEIIEANKEIDYNDSLITIMEALE